MRTTSANELPTVESLVRWLHKRLFGESENASPSSGSTHGAGVTTTSTLMSPSVVKTRYSGVLNLKDALEQVRDFEPEIIERARIADDNERAAKAEKQKAIDKMMKTLKQEKGLYDIKETLQMQQISGGDDVAAKVATAKEDKSPRQQWRERTSSKKKKSDMADAAGKKTSERMNKRVRDFGKEYQLQKTDAASQKRSAELEARAAAAERRAEQELSTLAESTKANAKRRSTIDVPARKTKSLDAEKGESAESKTTKGKLENSSSKYLTPNNSNSMNPEVESDTPLPPLENLIYQVSWAQTQENVYMTLSFSSQLKECLAFLGKSISNAVAVTVTDD
eukprot:GSA25T00007607001.1